MLTLETQKLEMKAPMLSMCDGNLLCPMLISVLDMDTVNHFQRAQAGVFLGSYS